MAVETSANTSSAILASKRQKARRISIAQKPKEKPESKNYWANKALGARGKTDSPTKQNLGGSVSAANQLANRFQAQTQQNVATSNGENASETQNVNRSTGAVAGTKQSIQAKRQAARLQQQQAQSSSQNTTGGQIAATLASSSASQATAQKLLGDRTADLLYTNLIPSFGLTLIPLNMWMMGFWPKKFGEFRGPYVFKHKVAGWVVVLFLDMIIMMAFAISFVQLAIIAWVWTHPGEAIITLGDVIFNLLTGG